LAPAGGVIGDNADKARNALHAAAMAKLTRKQLGQRLGKGNAGRRRIATSPAPAQRASPPPTVDLTADTSTDSDADAAEESAARSHAPAPARPPPRSPPATIELDDSSDDDEVCDYKYDSLLKLIDEALAACPLELIRAWERRLWRWIDAYASDKPLAEASEEVRALGHRAQQKMKSHRRAPGCN
jgi:hypothetical protein